MVKPTKLNDVHPIGYVEFQTAWVGEKTLDERDAIVIELWEKIAREAPGLVKHGSRIEWVDDGAGVRHYHLYIGMCPPVPAAPPLGNNMNDAPTPQPGFGPEPGDNMLPIGHFEEKFGRGGGSGV